MSMRRRFYVQNHLLIENRPALPDEMPFVRRLLPQDATQAKMTPRLIINHTQAASRAIPMDQAWDTDSVRKDGIESHLLADQQGRGMQCMRFNVVAHTSFKANLFVIDGVAYGQVSVESQDDGGAGLANDPWTEPQLEFLCQAWAAVCVAYDIPVQAVPVWNGQGVSQHNAFPEWSKDAHSCPGPARTAQMPAMRARIQQIIDDDPDLNPPPFDPTEDDMAMKLLQPFDCDAQFLGMADRNGVCLEVVWADGPRADAHLAAGATIDNGLSFGGLTNCVLLGPLPTGDTRHEWTGAEFFRVVS